MANNSTRYHGNWLFKIFPKCAKHCLNILYKINFKPFFLKKKYKVYPSFTRRWKILGSTYFDNFETFVLKQSSQVCLGFTHIQWYGHRKRSQVKYNDVFLDLYQGQIFSFLIYLNSIVIKIIQLNFIDIWLIQFLYRDL